MFEGFFKSKFITKCKSALKLMKIRIEGIKKKRNAMQKYLRNDIADLLRNNFDLNAYSRAEGLQNELNMSACYDFVEQFCKTISEHLSVMNKQQECPEECKEAVPSLMFAAARFADLPELRELRTIFVKKYGHNLDAHVNQEFVYKLKANHPMKETKLQLLHDIAVESGLEWDPKALEQQLYKPPPTDQIWHKKRRNKPVVETEKRDIEIEEDDIPSTEESEVSSDDCKIRSSEKNVCIDHINEDSDQEKGDKKKPVSYRYIPPPYTKSTKSVENHETKPKPRSVRKRNLKAPPGTESTSLDHEDIIGNEKKIGNKKSFHSRTVSLPPEDISLTDQKKKGHSRKLSFQPDGGLDAHPKLLDYDDFVARLGALKEK